MSYVHKNIRGDLSDYSIEVNSTLKGTLFGDIKVTRVLRAGAFHQNAGGSASSANYIAELRDVSIMTAVVYVPYSRLLRDARGAFSFKKIKDLFNETINQYKSEPMTIAKNAQNQTPVTVLSVNENNVFNFLLDVVKLARTNKEVASYLKKVADLV